MTSFDESIAACGGRIPCGRLHGRLLAAQARPRWPLAGKRQGGARAEAPPRRCLYDLARMTASPPSRLVVLGYIAAFALPVVGLVLGIIIVTRPDKSVSKHGPWIILINLIATAIFVAVLGSGVLSSSTNDLGY